MGRNEPYERKIQLTGGTTYTVSLPKEWANEQALETGSRLRLHPRGDRLLLTQPAEDAQRRTIRISAARHDTDQIGRLIEAAYIAGAETIHIVDGPKRTECVAVRDAVAGLVGIEIVSEEDGAVQIQAMLDVEDLSPKQTVVQMERMAASMHEEAIAAVVTGDPETGAHIAGLDDTVDRLFRLVAREFQGSLVDVRLDRAGNGLTAFDYYTVARQIERVADHAEKIAGTATLLDREPPDEIAGRLTQLGTDAREVVRGAVSGTMNGRDIDTLAAVLDDGRRVTAAAAELDRELHECDLADGYTLATVLDSVERTAEYGINVAEAGLQAALRRNDGVLRSNVSE
ncbi:phosphate signaling complex PhoU family protein [Halorubrum vacuolatum]|uniref:Phosphate uptake regulator n=1 Tax=Halorubrum vacuolatum TaxID=63740 RepID=A0A238UVZ1_HALVU|nr:phosphate uptake regulator PhoU [Halorubrum vacuolatum]SNR25907.1 Phosphate uptake regulator [Halorubrum vacuolatum]